jgi:hypothetical protein
MATVTGRHGGTVLIIQFWLYNFGYTILGRWMRTLKQNLEFQYRLKNLFQTDKKQSKTLIQLKLTRISFSVAITADLSSIPLTDAPHLTVTIKWHTHTRVKYIFLSDKTIGYCFNRCNLTLSLLMSYIYGAPSKAINLTYIYIYIWTKVFTGDFASWTVHFINICKKNQQIHQLFIQFINYVW